jgi:hypothetical protein
MGSLIYYQSALAQSELTKIKGEMFYFLMSQVIKGTGEFYDSS